MWRRAFGVERRARAKPWRQTRDFLQYLLSVKPCSQCSHLIISGDLPETLQGWHSLPLHVSLMRKLRLREGQKLSQRHNIHMLDLGHQPMPFGLTPKPGAFAHLLAP